MSLQKINPTQTFAWQMLLKHYQEMHDIKMQDMFDKDKTRVEKLHISWEDFLVDFSKNKINQQTIELLVKLANEVQLSEGIQSMVSGKIINETESRAVGHVFLRDLSNVWENNQHSLVSSTLKQIEEFTDKVLSGELKGTTKKAFTDVVNIGIGGSDLGPKMVVEALSDYHTSIRTHYISNIDYDLIAQKLEQLNPETTLVIVVSKSFGTKETLANADLFKSWLTKNNLLIKDHLVAVTSAPDKAILYGVEESAIFPMWDWVGGRFSLWSAVGLSIALSIGYNHFEELLLGAHEMDMHFVNTPFEKNIPTILALLSIWYANFYNYETEAYIPYSSRMYVLPAYLQQVMMESNGKNTSRNGDLVNYHTGTIVWGEVGTNSQHAFFQLFHQGTKIIPTDFIGFINPFQPSEMHDQLMANFFAQTEGLMNGKVGELYNNKVDNDSLSAYRTFEGNRPTNTILIHKLTPKTLGALLAMYEHKTFVQGYIWNIYSFDQFGVEYGKVLADSIQDELREGTIKQHDCSTKYLLNYYLNHRK